MTDEAFLRRVEEAAPEPTPEFIALEEARARYRAALRGRLGNPTTLEADSLANLLNRLGLLLRLQSLTIRAPTVEAELRQRVADLLAQVDPLWKHDGLTDAQHLRYEQLTRAADDETFANLQILEGHLSE